jgi:hypothetical protein
MLLKQKQSLNEILTYKSKADSDEMDSNKM